MIQRHSLTKTLRISWCFQMQSKERKWKIKIPTWFFFSLSLQQTQHSQVPSLNINYLIWFDFFYFHLTLIARDVISCLVSKQSWKVASQVFKTRVPSRNQVSNTRDPELPNIWRWLFPCGAMLKSSF